MTYYDPQRYPASSLYDGAWRWDAAEILTNLKWRSYPSDCSMDTERCIWPEFCPLQPSRVARRVSVHPWRCRSRERLTSALPSSRVQRERHWRVRIGEKKRRVNAWGSVMKREDAEYQQNKKGYRRDTRRKSGFSPTPSTSLKYKSSRDRIGSVSNPSK